MACCVVTGRSSVDTDLVAKLYTAGHGTQFIAKQLNVDSVTVWRHLVRAGLHPDAHRSRNGGTEKPNRYRKYYLPKQIAATRLKLAALEAEAKRYGLIVEVKE